MEYHSAMFDNSPDNYWQFSTVEQKSKKKKKNSSLLSTRPNDNKYFISRPREIFDAIRKGDVESVKRMLEDSNARWDFPNKNCFSSPMHTAIFYGQFEIVKLLTLYVDINQKALIQSPEDFLPGGYPEYFTPLEYAEKLKSIEIANFLKEKVEQQAKDRAHYDAFYLLQDFLPEYENHEKTFDYKILKKEKKDKKGTEKEIKRLKKIEKKAKKLNEKQIDDQKKKDKLQIKKKSKQKSNKKFYQRLV